MNPRLSLSLLLIWPLMLFSQAIVIQNGHKTRGFWEGEYVQIGNCTNCDPSILDDCAGNYNLFDAKIQMVEGDSLHFLVHKIKIIRKEAGTSVQVQSIRFRDKPQELILAKNQIDLIRKSHPPRVRSIRRAGGLVGCILLTLGLGDYFNALSDTDGRIIDKTKKPLTNASILVGGLGLGQLYKKKYYLTPLIKGSECREVWNIEGMPDYATAQSLKR